MKYYLDLFSPETYEAFSRSDRSISGFRERQRKAASRVEPGDHLICYMTKTSRWCGILEVLGESFHAEEPIFYPENDPFTVRFRVKPIVWLERDRAVPIHERTVWEELSFTKGHDPQSTTWTGKVRGSLVGIDEEDGELLERIMLEQQTGDPAYPIADEVWRKLVRQTVRRQNGSVAVTVPEEEPIEEQALPSTQRDSHRIQGLLASIGEKMGFKVWLPKADRGAVQQSWNPDPGILIDVLPLNYDDITLRTIEQIDVLWVKGRSIVRAFEVEHTTSVYSGLLRMADLLALQPNMDIRLHIVAPSARREKVFQEIQRPVFSLLERGPLAGLCTFISYDSVEELAQTPHLAHMSDSIVEEYEEEPD